eukprot:GHVN01047989.1.p1 GENE.GHVN01047989.1~~GHVN01047989.1.p1  ORF type:complete len:621 (+),score=53.65 GHVN01047989.1:1269-3131(+)
MSNSTAAGSKWGLQSAKRSRRPAVTLLEEEVRNWILPLQRGDPPQKLVQPTIAEASISSTQKQNRTETAHVTVGSTSKRSCPQSSDEHLPYLPSSDEKNAVRLKEPSTPKSTDPSVSWASVVNGMSPRAKTHGLNSPPIEREGRPRDPSETLHGVTSDASGRPLDPDAVGALKKWRPDEQPYETTATASPTDQLFSEGSREQKDSPQEEVGVFETLSMHFEVASHKSDTSWSTIASINCRSLNVSTESIDRPPLFDGATRGLCDHNSHKFRLSIAEHEVLASGANDGRADKESSRKSWGHDGGNFLDGTVNSWVQPLNLLPEATRSTSNGCSIDDGVDLGSYGADRESESRKLEAIEARCGERTRKSDCTPETSDSEASEKLTPGSTPRFECSSIQQGRRDQLESQSSNPNTTNVPHIDHAWRPSSPSPRIDKLTPLTSLHRFVKRFPESVGPHKVLPEKAVHVGRSWGRPPLMPTPQSPPLLVNPLNVARKMQAMDPNAIIMRPAVPWWADASSKYANSAPRLPPRRRNQLATNPSMLPIKRETLTKPSRDEDSSPGDPTMFGDTVSQVQPGFYSQWGSAGEHFLAFFLGALNSFHERQADHAAHETNHAFSAHPSLRN